MGNSITRGSLWALLKIAQNYRAFNSNENHRVSSKMENYLVILSINSKHKFPTSAELRRAKGKYSNIAARVLNLLALPKIFSHLAFVYLVVPFLFDL